VVVFRYPLDPRLFYIKRIIGLPDDLVTVGDGKVVVNGQDLSETYLDEGLVTTGRVSVVVKPGELFAMGDNRPHSFDSRNFGAVPFANIIGVVKLRLLPTARAGTINRPFYEGL